MLSSSWQRTFRKRKHRDFSSQLILLLSVKKVLTSVHMHYASFNGSLLFRSCFSFVFLVSNFKICFISHSVTTVICLLPKHVTAQQALLWLQGISSDCSDDENSNTIENDALASDEEVEPDSN